MIFDYFNYALKSRNYNKKNAKPVFFNVRKNKSLPTQVRQTAMFTVLDSGFTSAYFPITNKQGYCPFVMEKGQGYVKHKEMVA
mgnify:CR=1 FL=1|tara:strand:+ start:302 stop:550 length:249 start_codon:yes stop_codon:yes gene_type:complete